MKQPYFIPYVENGGMKRKRLRKEKVRRKNVNFANNLKRLGYNKNNNTINVDGRTASLHINNNKPEDGNGDYAIKRIPTISKQDIKSPENKPGVHLSKISLQRKGGTFTGNHELQHATSQLRYIRGLKRGDLNLDENHNRSEFTKDERKHILAERLKLKVLRQELNNARSRTEYGTTSKKLSDAQNKYINFLQSTKVGKNDKKFMNTSNNYITYINHNNKVNRTGLNKSHDNRPDEIDADNFAAKHSTNKEIDAFTNSQNKDMRTIANQIISRDNKSNSSRTAKNQSIGLTKFVRDRTIQQNNIRGNNAHIMKNDQGIKHLN